MQTNFTKLQTFETWLKFSYNVFDFLKIFYTSKGGIQFLTFLSSTSMWRRTGKSSIFQEIMGINYRIALEKTYKMNVPRRGHWQEKLISPSFLKIMIYQCYHQKNFLEELFFPLGYPQGDLIKINCTEAVFELKTWIFVIDEKTLV